MRTILRHGRIVGTADYLSPDQVRRPLEPEPGLGHLLAGLHAVLLRDRQGAVSGRHDGRQGRAPTANCGRWTRAALNFRLSPAFVEVMADMMAKEPAQRIPSAREVRRRLEPFLAASAVPFVPAAAPAVVAVAAPPIVRPPRDEPQACSTGFQPVSGSTRFQPGSSSTGFQPVSKRGQGGRATTRPPGNGIWPLALLVLTPIAPVAAVLLVRYLVIAMLR